MSRVDELPADQRPARIEATVIRIPLLERCESTKEISDRMAIALQKREPFQKLVVRSSQADSKRRELELSLLEGFATCLHVLGFYENRIAEEGYLRTAHEDRSILSLVRPLGVRPTPPLAASAMLSFTAARTPSVDGSSWVDQGTGVQSIPNPGTLPQVFETIEPLLIRPEWNDMSPVPSSKREAPHLWTHATAVILRGAASSVRPGARVLITGDVDGEPFWTVQIIARIGRLTRKGVTVVSWDRPLRTDAEPTRVECAQVRILGSEIAIFGSNAADWNSLRLRDQLLYSQRVGGLSVKKTADKQWQGVATPDAMGRVLCLHHAGDNTLYAGVQDGGVFKSRDSGETWVDSSSGIRMASVFCMTENTIGHLVVGTRSKGVFTSADGGESWTPVRGNTAVKSAWPIVKRVANRLPKTAVRALLCFSSNAGGQTVQHIVAGTDAGLFSFEQGGGHWRALHEKLPMVVKGSQTANLSVRSVVADPKTNEVFIATDHGIWATSRLGSTWEARDPLSPGAAIRVLTIDGFGSLFACPDDGGLYRSDNSGQSWSAVGADQTGPFRGCVIRDVVHLADPGGRLKWIFVVTDDGLWQSSDRGATWNHSSEGLHSEDLEALTVNGRGDILTSAPLLGVVDDDWPGFALSADPFELSKDVGDLAPDVPLIIEQTDPDTARLRRALLTVEHCTTMDVSHFGLSKRVSRLRLHETSGLENFHRLWAQVRVPGRALRMSSQQVSHPRFIANVDAELDETLAIPGTYEAMTVDAHALDEVPRESLEFAEVLPDLTDRMIGIRGRRMQVIPRAPLTLRDENTQATESFEQGSSLKVMQWPLETETGFHWQLRGLHGFEGSAKASPDMMRIAPALTDDPELTVLRKVVFVEKLRDGTRLVLDRPLDIFLDINTVSVFGNIVEARQGRSVEEVIGSGNAALSNQRFQIRQTPVSWYLHDGKITCDLELRVSDQLWHQVEDFQSHGPNEHVFVVETDHEGSTWVLFGDGWHGARLPSGHENIKASFKMGAGPSGNSEVDRVRLVRSRAMGIRKTSNIVPSTGGCPAEDTASLRRRAPIAARTLDRIISLQDLEDFIESMPEVAQVDARMVWGGSRRLLFLSMSTTETENYHQMLEDSPLATSIRGLLSRFGLNTPAIQIASFRPRFFSLHLELLVSMDFNPDVIKEQASAIVVSLFAFENRRLGQPVTALEVISILAPIEGLVNVRVIGLGFNLNPEDSFDDSGLGTPAVPPMLATKLAHWSETAGRILPSEMLFLHPGRGLQLTTQSAT